MIQETKIRKLQSVFSARPALPARSGVLQISPHDDTDIMDNTVVAAVMRRFMQKIGPHYNQAAPRDFSVYNLI